MDVNVGVRFQFLQTFHQRPVSRAPVLRDVIVICDVPDVFEQGAGMVVFHAHYADGILDRTAMGGRGGQGFL